MKCPICNQKKGKRVCKLAEEQSICPPCCGTIRRAECSGCRYHELSLAVQQAKQMQREANVADSSPDVETLCDQALTLVEQGHHVEAMTQFRELYRQVPHHPMVLYGIGLCYAMKGAPDEACPYFEQVIAIAPELVEARYNLGLAYLQLHDMEKGVAALEATIAADGADGLLGQMARERLNEIEAITLKQGVNLRDYIANRRIFAQGCDALEEDRFQEAIRLFEQVVATAPRHVQSYGNMGLAYAGLGQVKKAIECLNKAIELDPHYEPALFNRQIIEHQEEGTCVPGIGKHSVHYYREKAIRERIASRLLAEAPTQNRRKKPNRKKKKKR